MLRNLSQYERDALVSLAHDGPSGECDPIAMSKLFTLGLLTITPQRMVVLTDKGREFYAEILRHAEANEKQREIRPDRQ